MKKCKLVLALVLSTLMCLCFAACGGTDPGKGDDPIEFVAPTNQASYWDAYTLEQYDTEDVTAKTLSYELEGFKDHYGGMQLSALVRLYSDGFAWEEVYMTVAFGGNAMSMPMYHYGYWELDDGEISVTMVAFKGISGDADNPAKVEALTANTSIALEDNKLAGQAVYNIFTYGLDYAPVEGGNKTKYATIEEFHEHAKQVWQEWKDSQPPPEETPAE